MILGTFLISEILAVTTPVQIEGVAPVCKSEELGEERVNYEQLCRGEEFVTVEERSKMMCRYNFGKHSFLKIGPLKEEEVFLYPRIVLFHDFLTESEMDTIRDMATPRFKRATVQNYITGELETANYR